MKKSDARKADTNRAPWGNHRHAEVTLEAELQQARAAGQERGARWRTL